VIIFPPPISFASNDTKHAAITSAVPSAINLEARKIVRGREPISASMIAPGNKLTVIPQNTIKMTSLLI
jgi:hypothetical protein